MIFPVSIFTLTTCHFPLVSIQIIFPFAHIVFIFTIHNSAAVILYCKLPSLFNRAIQSFHRIKPEEEIPFTKPIHKSAGIMYS